MFDRDRGGSCSGCKQLYNRFSQFSESQAPPFIPEGCRYFVLLALIIVLLGVLQRQAIATCARIYMRRWVHDSNACSCFSWVPTVRCCCSGRVRCCSVVLVRTLQHCSVPNVKKLYSDAEDGADRGACCVAYVSGADSDAEDGADRGACCVAYFFPCGVCRMVLAGAPRVGPPEVTHRTACVTPAPLRAVRRLSMSAVVRRWATQLRPSSLTEVRASTQNGRALLSSTYLHLMRVGDVGPDPGNF